VEPFNEPVDGGMGKMSDDEWNRKKLYPFYDRSRKIMDETGWEEKIIFPEPLVFWITNAPFTSANSPYPKGFSRGTNWGFNSHYYDALRMSIGLKEVRNGSYIANMDHIRKTAKRMGTLPFLSEFGMWLENGRVKNHVRMVNADYQGMEISKELKSNFVEFYTPLISGTQWHWDIYHNHHKEYLNFTPKLITSGDGWNGENFSEITNFGTQYTAPDRYLVERIWPKRCQGEIMHFFYNAMPFDGRKDFLDWGALKFSSSKEFYLKNSRFALLVFQGSSSKGPTEIFIPSHFLPQKTYVITENKILKLTDLDDEEISFKGSDLLVLSKGSPSDLHFALIVQGAFSQNYLEILQEKIKQSLFKEHKSPVYLTGKVRIDDVRIGSRRVPFEKIKLE
jgi:hypothetical protein